MNYPKPPTPFPTYGYFGPQYFCDREEELNTLLQYFRGNIPTVLVGIRRLGKTGLIHHLFHHLRSESDASCIYIDLQNTTNFDQLVSRMAEGIAAILPERKFPNIWEKIKQMRPLITFDEFTGVPQITLRFEDANQSQKSFSTLLQSLSRQKKKIVLAFDEFQQILNYENISAEANIRSEMQKFANIHYIFSGSQSHLISRIFSHANRPFYGITSRLALSKIDHDQYAEFISRHFKKKGKKINSEIIDELLKWTYHHTYYTQYVCNQLFTSQKQILGLEDLNRTKIQILNMMNQDFLRLRDIVSKGHWKILKAISIEEKLFTPYAKAITTKYDLDNSNAIKKALESLRNNQLIFDQFSESGEKYYAPLDPFLSRWMQYTYRYN